MVGTPRLPLKYRRKGNPDYRIHSPDLDMSYHSPLSAYSSHLSSEDYVLGSPTLYSSSSSVAPSSPIRSLRTPEPPSSPSCEPCIANSPKTFWEVAFNYGPDFPYKPRAPVKTNTSSGRVQLSNKRQSSCYRTPVLVSDVDHSEYSEDNENFHIDEDSTDETDTNSETAVHVSRETSYTISSRPPGSKVMDANGEIDVAAVLLDLSRHARRSGESRSLEAPKQDLPILSISADTIEPEDPDLSSESIKPSDPFAECTTTLDAGILSDHSISISKQSPLKSDEPVEINKTCEEISLKVDSLVKIENVTDELTSYAPHHGDSDESTISYAETDVSPLLEPPTDAGQHVIEDVSHSGVLLTDCNIEPITDNDSNTVYASELTPLSSPVLSSNDLLGFNEPLSPLSSPPAEPCELPELPLVVSADTELLHVETFAKDGSQLRSGSPVPGPSTLRLEYYDHHVALSEPEGSVLPKRKRSKRPLSSELGFDCTDTLSSSEKKTVKKKRCSGWQDGDTTRDPTVDDCVSISTVTKSRKKRCKKSAAINVSVDHEAISLSSTSHKQSYESHESSATVDEVDESTRNEVTGYLIQVMALARASSMPASSLLREILRENPNMKNQRSQESWITLLESVLAAHDVFGRIDREGLDADDNPLETQWFYVPENDPDQSRATLLREMMPKKRNATKTHKQYFYKPLGKISRWDPEDAL